MPRVAQATVMTPEQRRREVALVLAAAVLRLRPRSADPFPEDCGEKTLTGLESAPSSATHVIVREDVASTMEEPT